MISKTLFCFALVAIVIFHTGCDDSDSSSNNGSSGGSSSNSVISIAGSWSGIYYRTDQAGEESINATITQDGSAVVINTTKNSTPGQFFTGTISSSAYLTLTDGSDGETWTSHFGPATASSINIADYITAPSTGNPNPGLHIIQISK